MAISIYSAKEAKKYMNNSQITICVKYFFLKKSFLVLANAILFFALGGLAI